MPSMILLPGVWSAVSLYVNLSSSTSRPTFFFPCRLDADHQLDYPVQDRHQLHARPESDDFGVRALSVLVLDPSDCAKCDPRVEAWIESVVCSWDEYHAASAAGVLLRLP